MTPMPTPTVVLLLLPMAAAALKQTDSKLLYENQRFEDQPTAHAHTICKPALEFKYYV
jgi:hypothetical protein